METALMIIGVIFIALLIAAWAFASFIVTSLHAHSHSSKDPGWLGMLLMMPTLTLLK